jgi:hypothetical protein
MIHIQDMEDNTNTLNIIINLFLFTLLYQQ